MTRHRPATPRFRQTALILLTTAALAGLAAGRPAVAQSTSAVLGEGGSRGQRGGGRPKGAPPAADMAPKLQQQPLQRLEAGALLCRTEADLQLHEAAVTARLDGGDASEPAGCHIVRVMMPVSVVQRHGLARTEVKAGDQLGWTDTVIRNP